MLSSGSELDCSKKSNFSDKAAVKQLAHAHSNLAMVNDTFFCKPILLYILLCVLVWKKITTFPSICGIGIQSVRFTMLSLISAASVEIKKYFFFFFLDEICYRT